MLNSENEDQEHKKKMSMEDSKTMTIEFLRARLLSERSISKAARQRADELSKRVSELEEQLKFVYIMRKKAEKATTDVLAILENHGISDVSEGFDSNSDEGETLHKVNSDTTTKETSTKLKGSKNELETYYSSEIESSPSTGRSLAWKSAKDSNSSLEDKKYLESIRRRSNFALNSSAARRTGKSCRRIRRRENRAIEEFQNDVLVKTKLPTDATICSDGESTRLREKNEFDDPEKLVENTMLEPYLESQKINDLYIRVQQREQDMESALQLQARLIGRFEEEEKAQRAWEEKYTEKNSVPQDSLDPGNHSDLTEEGEEIKLCEAIDDGGGLSLNNEERKEMPSVTLLSEELQSSKSFPSQEDEEKGFWKDQSCRDKITCESAASEAPFPALQGQKDQEISKLHSHALVDSLQQYMCVSYVPSSPCHTEKSMKSDIPVSSSSSTFELAVVPKGTPNSLGSVLEALQQAKSSLQQTLNGVPPVARESENTPDMIKVQTGCSALFRLPTDDQFKASALANQPDTGSFPHQISGDTFFTNPYIEPGIALSNDIFLTGPFSTSMFRTDPSSTSTEVRRGAVHQRSLSQPGLNTGPPSLNRTNNMDPFTNIGFPSFKAFYPFPSNSAAPQPSLNKEALRTFSTSETARPPVACLSSYNAHASHLLPGSHDDHSRPLQ